MWLDPRHCVRPRFAMRFDCVQQPEGEPITIDDMREHCRIDEDDDSQTALIDGFISYAREYAEDKTGRSLLTQQWLGTADAFPGCDEPQDIALLHGPVTAVVSVVYLATDGTTQTLVPSTYVLDASGGQPRLAPAYGSRWPATLRQIGAVKVLYATGYGADGSAVPNTIRRWMQIRVATLYEHREEVEQVPRGKLEPLAFVDGMLDAYRFSPI